MQRLLRIALLPFLLIGCNSSGEIPYEDVEIVAISGGLEKMKVFFRLPEGVECEGIHIDSLGNSRIVTFFEIGHSSSSQIHSKAVLATEGAFAGALLVEVPIPIELRDKGDQVTLKLHGDEETRFTWTVTGNQD